MNTHKLNLKTIVLILSLAIAGQAYAKTEIKKTDDKKVVRISMSDTFIKMVSARLEISAIEIENAMLMIEGWMFSENYYYTENEPEIESWMLEDDYLFTEAEPAIENWMLEDNYLFTEAEPAIESWMLEDNHFGSPEAEPVLEDWMFDAGNPGAETGPVIEDWMFQPLSVN